jgi:hypothetical protein
MKLQDLSENPKDEYAGIIDTFENYADQIDDRLPFTEMPMMIGSYKGDRARELYQRYGWGRMHANTKEVDPYPGEPWGLDNGAWTAHAKGKPFPMERWKERVENAAEVAEERNAPPMVAVVPDIVQGGMESLEFSLAMVEWCQDNYPQLPWYLAIQNNFTFEIVEDVIDDFDGLFLGGGDQMKFAARSWIKVAKKHDLNLHYARCGTKAKLMHAFSLGVDSMDSAFPLFATWRFHTFIQLYTQLYDNYFGT